MRKAIQKAALAGLVFGSASAGFGGTIRHDLTHTPYLGLGDQIEYRSTGAVYVSYDLGWGLTFSSTLASGVLIAPNWVLTAAHVVDALKSDASATYMGFVPGEQDPNVGSPLLTPPGSPYHEMDLTYSVSHPSWTAARDE